MVVGSLHGNTANAPNRLMSEDFAMSRAPLVPAVLCAILACALTGCSDKVKADASAEAPPPAKVERELDANFVKVDHPDQFPLMTAGKYMAAPELKVTGVVNPDVSRNVPAISLA